MKSSGWLSFSAIILLVAGIMRIFDAIWALMNTGTAAANLHGAILGHSLTTYGVVWLIVGLILCAAGFLVLNPDTLSAKISRWVGILAAAIGGITAIAWMPYYPVWSLVYIGTAIVVIYGLIAGFAEVRDSSPTYRASR